ARPGEASLSVWRSQSVRDAVAESQQFDRAMAPELCEGLALNFGPGGSAPHGASMPILHVEECGSNRHATRNEQQQQAPAAMLPAECLRVHGLLTLTIWYGVNDMYACVGLETNSNRPGFNFEARTSQQKSLIPAPQSSVVDSVVRPVTATTGAHVEPT